MSDINHSLEPRSINSGETVARSITGDSTGTNTRRLSVPSKPQAKPPVEEHRVKSFCKTVLRALGLPILLHTFEFVRHPLGKGFHEPLKVAIHRNRSLALVRAVIHLIPVSAALCEIILNWNTYYVGAVSYSQATYQLLAKVHELFIQASIAAVLFSCIRYELAFGEGMPFGLLLSGLQITQVSYLWSMEFWGSLRSGLRCSIRRFLTLVLVALCILLASVCGPSSAVLLIPRSQYWPGGNTDIWINGTYAELWPNATNANSIPQDCAEITPDRVPYYCPSSEWGKIRDYLSLSKQILPLTYINRFAVTQEPNYLELADRSSTRRMVTIEDESYFGSGPRPIVAMTQHAGIADALTSTGALWFLSLTNVTARKGHGSPASDQSDARHTILNGYKQPYSTIVCIPEPLTAPQDETPIHLPILPNANADSLANGNSTYDGCSPGTHFTAETIAHPSMTRGQVFNLSTSSSQFKLHWIELGSDLFQGSSIGAIVVPPRAATNKTQNVFLCNLSAGWGTATLTMHTYAGSTSIVNSEVTHRDGHKAKSATIQETNVPDSQGGGGNEENSYFEYHLPQYPQQVVNISQGWAQYLNPTILGLNTTVINTILQEKVFSCSPRVSIEHALADLVVNGLAKSGARSQLQGTVRMRGPNGDEGLDGNYWLYGKGNVFSVDSNESQDWVKLHVDSTFQGYAYNTTGSAPRIAIAFLTTYCILAFGHLLYAAWTGISSTCWDSIAELTVLAMNSSPTDALRNTCAGIRELHIFKLPVRLLVRNDVEGEGEHLELVFGCHEQEKPDSGTIKANRAYGTMPTKKKQQ